MQLRRRYFASSGRKGIVWPQPCIVLLDLKNISVVSGVLRVGEDKTDFVILLLTMCTSFGDDRRVAHSLPNNAKQMAPESQDLFGFALLPSHNSVLLITLVGLNRYAVVGGATVVSA